LLRAADEHYWELVMEIDPHIKRFTSKLVRNWNVSSTEYVGAGQEWAYRAALRFDPRRGVPFLSYAYHWIRTGVERAHSDTSFVIRLPGNVLTLRWTIYKIVREFESKGEPWTFHQIAGIVGADLDTVHAAYYGRMTLPIEKAVGREAQCDVEATAAGREVRSILQDLATKLPERNQEVLGRRFGVWGSGVSESATEIGNSMNLTRQGVAYNLKRSLETLRCRAPEDLRLYVF
jgi:DNA-directed RNA polymerase sigma subunit (sigma70/sigma32)